MRKCPEFPLKVDCQVSLVASHEEPAVFLSAVVHISRILNGVRHCACNPLSQYTTPHITTVAMDDSLVWDAEIVQH